MEFIYVSLIGLIVIAYIDAIVVIIKEAKKRDGADPFTAGFFATFLSPPMGFLYLLLFKRD